MWKRHTSVLTLKLVEFEFHPGTHQEKLVWIREEILNFLEEILWLSNESRSIKYSKVFPLILFINRLQRWTTTNEPDFALNCNKWKWTALTHLINWFVYLISLFYFYYTQFFIHTIVKTEKQNTQSKSTFSVQYNAIEPRAQFPKRQWRRLEAELDW